MAVVASLATARPDQAVFGWKVTFTVPMLNPQPDYAKLTFRNTGGSIKNVVQTMGPPGMVSPAGNMIVFQWDDKVPANTVIMATFTTAFGGIEFDSGEWRNQGDFVANFTPGSVTVEQVAVPTLSEWGLIAMGVLMLGGGAVAVRWFGRAV